MPPYSRLHRQAHHLLGLCAAVLYTAADALIGYFHDKGGMARLNG